MNISIDLETFSDVDISKGGVYRYAESDNFEILLFAYAVDGGEVVVVDMAQGEKIPENIINAITDRNITKWAFNSQFERICLSMYFKKHRPELMQGNYLEPEGWKCSMTWCAYMGLPMSLAGAGAVLGLEQQKLTEGKELIRYFCIPCKPTKANGGRIRNLPEHDTAKWENFVRYNKRDVEVEMAIQAKLSHFPVPENIWEEFWIDQRINDRGIEVDMEFARNAIELDKNSRETLMEEVRDLTGLENPNSVIQLKEWLHGQGLEFDSLDKKAVAAILPTAPPVVQKVLRIRQKLAKSSVKKYQAMENTVCNDSRARGMFRFYGASRTGRWSGKSIQLQNLPQNHISDLAEARALVKAGSFEAVSMLYDDVPDTLSQLIRTAFVPKTGYKFVVADFSAIEARVLAYLANEQWVLDTFAAGKDIYCATASKMFHCNVEKNGENGELRQKGKQATLSCIAEGSLVLTNIGLVPIERVTTDMLLWDGESWVHHDGVIYKGEREVITYEGLTATPDHLVWVEGAQRPIHLGIAAACGAHLLQTGDGRRALWLGRDNQCGETMEETMESLLCFDTLYQMWECSVAVIQQSDQRYIKRLSTVLAATSDTHVAGKKTGCRKIKVRKSKCTRVFKLRRAGDKIYVCICNSCREVFDGSIFPAGQISGYRQDRHEWPLCSWESAFCNESGKLCKSEKKCIVQIRAEVLALLSKCSSQKVIKGFKSGGNYKGSRKGCIGKTEAVESNQCKARLYDIRNAGRHHRFTVSGKLVHNCGYGGSVGALIAMGALESGMEENELQPLVDAWRKANPHIVNFWWSVDGAAKEAVIGRTTTSTHGIRFICKSGMLFIELPSGRRLAYVKPKMGENRFGGESITYEGTNGTTKKWERLETFGGKLVENCLAEGTLVLTDRGYIPIQMIKQSDLIWDGIEWVTHDGIAYQGIKTTVAVGSLHMTNNHKILTEKGWIECGKAEGFNWAEVRLPDRFRTGGEQQKWENTLEMQVRMWKRGCLCGERSKERNSLLWLQEKAIYRREEENSWNVKAPSLGCMAFNEAALYRFESSCLQKLWRAWHNCLSKMAGKFREFLGGYGTYLDQRIGFGQNRQRERIFTRELSMDNKENKLQQQKNFKDFENKVLGDSPFCSCGNDGTEANYFAVPAKPRVADRITVSETGLSESVYDIRNCGPRHRFTVLDNDKLRIVSNCTQAMARDILMFAIRNMKDYRIVAHVHDEVIVECPEDISVDSICQLMSKTPDWAEGLTLKAEGYEGKFYQK